MMPAVPMLAGVAAVLACVALGWAAVRARGVRIRIDAPEAAMDAAAVALAGFRPLAAAVGADGAAALVTGAGDRLAVLRAGRGRVRAREIDWQAVRATPGGIVVEANARPFAHVPLPGLDALDVRRLAPAARATA